MQTSLRSIDNHVRMLCRQPIAPRIVADPCRLDYWAQLPLRYSQHASVRCDERGIPALPYLPFDSRLADTDFGPEGVEAVVYKVPDDTGGFFVVLAPDGCVLTTYRNDGDGEKRRRLKERRRRMASIV